MGGSANVRLASVALALASAIVVGGTLGVAEAAGSHAVPVAVHKKHGKHAGKGVIHGALYKAQPFRGDPFELRVSKNGHSAHFVGSFVYSDAGCPTAPSGNEYLTPQNAPTISIARNGSFSGATASGPYRDTISGTFRGDSAPTRFTETIPGCAGDKPDVYRFTLRAHK